MKVAAHTSPNWADRPPDTDNCGKSHVAAIWSPIWGKVLGSVSPSLVRRQISVLGVPTYNSGL